MSPPLLADPSSDRAPTSRRSCPPRSTIRRAGSRSSRARRSSGSSRGWRPSPRSASRSWPMTRGRARGPRWPWPSPASTAGSSRPKARSMPIGCAPWSSASRSRSSATRSSRSSWPVSRRHPDGPATPIAFDTQVAAYILNASLRSQSIADVVAEQLDLILPPAKELPAVRASRSRGAVRRRRPGTPRGRPRAREPGSALPRDRAAADPGARPDGGSRRRPRPRGARAASPTSLPSRLPASRPRSMPASATSSTSAARSSLSRSCSSS